jgi:hypothetical protein
MTALFILALVAAAGVIAWLSTDRLLYDGVAHATWNNMAHYSKSTRTVFVVVDPKAVPLDNPIMVAEVSLAASERIRASGAAHPVQVTIMQRMFEKPRIASLKA